MPIIFGVQRKCSLISALIFSTRFLKTVASWREGILDSGMEAVYWPKWFEECKTQWMWTPAKGCTKRECYPEGHREKAKGKGFQSSNQIRKCMEAGYTPTEAGFAKSVLAATVTAIFEEWSMLIRKTVQLHCLGLNPKSMLQVQFRFATETLGK